MPEETNKPQIIYDLLESGVHANPDGPTFLRRRPGSDNSFHSYTYTELKAMTDQLIAGWVSSGLKSGDRVLLLCDPSSYWFVTDTSILSVGAVSVPRATDVTDDDILYIANHSEASLAVVQTVKTAEKLRRLADKLPTIKRIIVMEDANFNLLEGPDTLASVMQVGVKALAADANLVQRTLAGVDGSALATLIYTSGTTGAPKGVMLSQKGWITAVLNTLPRTGFQKGDRALSLLPPWHAFERGVEYAVVYLGLAFMVSDISCLRDDLKWHRPTIFPSVPRIWESVYNGILAKVKKESALKQAIFNAGLSIGASYNRWKARAFGYRLQIERPSAILSMIERLAAWCVLLVMGPLRGLSLLIFRPIRQALGGQIKFSVSGGSALPGVVDRFLSAIGLTVLEGYGMTETSAVISIRNRNRPTPGTVGTPIGGYTIRLKNEQGRDVSHIPGAKGTLWVKSDQILTGYYRRPELNEVVFDKEGFFDTGDLMLLTHRGELMFAGRSKDTIALAGGENIEPVPIEDYLLESEFIDQVMVVGDERKTLGALIVPAFDRLKEHLPSLPDSRERWNENLAVRALFQSELGRLINHNKGFKAFEHIPKDCFYIVPRQFDLETEMTRTLKMKRPVIKDHFAREIDEMYGRSRTGA
ncbi:MAG: long-chain fatty acid--CoA ligase [Spirochaetae bacterium HGW-Spirochaetae-10]|nr:MAG: long-chain fatty acid--CoA ligase [Spirochaetae bacterium HGW-Spirochaetae-10]